MNRLKMHGQVIKLITDADLSQLLETDPDKGLEVLMDTHIGLVYTIVHSKLYSLYSKEDIEECVSDVFMEVFAKRKELINHQKGSIKAILAIVARRRAIDLHRRIGKVVLNVPFVEEEVDIAHLKSSNQPEDIILKQEMGKELVSSILELGEPDSEIFIRKYFFEEKTKEIAKIIHLKESTINTKVSRGLEKLRNLLGGEKQWRTKSSK